MKIISSVNFVKVLIVSFVLTVVFLIVDSLLGITSEYQLNIWHFISSLLVVFTLHQYHMNSVGQGIAGGFLIFVLYFTIGHFNILIEAFFFEVLNLSDSLMELLRGGIAAIILAFIFVLIWKDKEDLNENFNFEERRAFGWTWRVLLVIFLYLIFYILAGMIVQSTIPNFMDFYENKIPAPELILLVQVLRGGIFAGITILICRTVELKYLHMVLLVGVIFAILGAIAPLIVPNTNMPQYIRLAHGFEVGISNFIFGTCAGLLLAQKNVNNNKG